MQLCTTRFTLPPGPLYRPVHFLNSRARRRQVNHETRPPVDEVAETEVVLAGTVRQANQIFPATTDG